MSDAGRCSKALYYKLTGEVEEPTPDTTLRVFEYGHQVHDWLQDLLLKSEELAGVYHSPEKTVQLVTPQFRAIYGHCDLLMGDDTVVEFKTTSAKGFRYFKAKSEASQSHKLQASLYATATGRQKIRIIYFSRTDDGDWFHEWNGEVNFNDVRQELERFDMIYNHAVNKTPPSVSYPHDKFPCSWGHGRCQYYTSCWGDYA